MAVDAHENNGLHFSAPESQKCGVAICNEICCVEAPPREDRSEPEGRLDDGQNTVRLSCGDSFRQELSVLANWLEMWKKKKALTSARWCLSVRVTGAVRICTWVEFNSSRV